MIHHLTIEHDGETVHIPYRVAGYGTNLHRLSKEEAKKQLPEFMKRLDIDPQDEKQMAWAIKKAEEFLNGQELVKQEPPYVANARQWKKTGSETAKKNMLLSIQKAVLLDLVRSSALEVYGWYAPVAVSAAVPVGMYYLDFKSQRIIFNESESTKFYIDSDGDRAKMVQKKKDLKAVRAKFPITYQPHIMTRTMVEPIERFYDFGMEDLEQFKEAFPVERYGVNVDLETSFFSKHVDPEIGIKTNSHDFQDLWESNKWALTKKLDYIYNSHPNEEHGGLPQRAVDVEINGLKKVRTGLMVSEFKPFRDHVLAPTDAWFLTGCNAIAETKAEKAAKQWDWFGQTDLRKHTDRLLRLQCEFIKPKDREPREETPAPIIEHGLFDRLLELGVLRFIEIDSGKDHIPNSCYFWLSTPNGNPVALTDVKRDGQEQGLTYVYTLAPVWSVRLKKFRFPLDHMRERLKEFDSAVRNPTTDEITSFWPKNKDQWLAEKFETKNAMLRQWLVDYVNEFGDPVATERADEWPFFKYPETAQIVAKNSIVIDYGKESTAEEMWIIANEANEQIKFNMCGNKGTSRRIRKYLLANEVGGSIFDSDCLGSLHRGGMNRSQLHRAARSELFTIAVVTGNTDQQTYITPTGVAKQEITNAFLAQTFNTLEEFEEFWESTSGDMESLKPAVVDYYTFSVNKRRCWTCIPKMCIKIGKLVDTLGNKVMPRGISQIHASLEKPVGNKKVEKIPVDLLFPIAELVKKRAHHAFCKKAKEAWIRVPNPDYVKGKSPISQKTMIVKCLLVTRRLYRTGAASENSPARWYTSRLRGMNAFPIHWQMFKLAKETNPGLEFKPRQCDLEFPEQLMEIWKKLSGFKPKKKSLVGRKIG